MKILMISSEAVPYAKSGGLADVVTALSRELVKKGHDVKILIPQYGFIHDSDHEVLPWNIHINIDSFDTTFRITKTELHQVEFLFLKHPLFTKFKGIYGNPGSPSYSNNMYRFTLFNYAVFEICRRVNWYPDIYHCHDWTTGLLPVLLKKSREKLFNNAASIMTIHNLAYQGVFSKHDIHLTNLLTDDLFTTSNRTSHKIKEINLLALGLLHADQITTVSPNYASEIQTREFGEGLNDLLNKRCNDLTGILNGVDYTEWNPESDQHLPVHYTSSSQKNKTVLKTELQRQMRLTEDPDIPIIGMVSRLVDQKGFRELCGSNPSALERIITDFPFQVIILGTGDNETEESLADLNSRFPNLSVSLTFNNYLAHLIEAGSDFFLMPSRFEPCGLNQIYSLRYGTIPIVRETGGLADTVEPFSDDFSRGTGIVFQSMSDEAIYQASAQANRLWSATTQNQRINIRKRCMDKRYEWESSADLYIEIYKKALLKGYHYE
ncbi:MAG: glycogen synthase [Spirochaetales bacterium]|nr:glycogen synthase [Spirochaetales bacterium]